MGLFHYQTFDRAVNTDKYLPFIRKLRQKHGEGRFVLYMDHLSVHKSQKAWDLYRELDIEPLMAPIYSPDYNPIEMMFSKLKNIIKRMRLQDMVKQVKKTYPQLLKRAVKEISLNDVNNYIRHVMVLF